jgi:hypothetical protein
MGIHLWKAHPKSPDNQNPTCQQNALTLQGLTIKVMVRNSEKQIISHIQNFIYFQVIIQWFFESRNQQHLNKVVKFCASINRCSNFWNILLRRVPTWRDIDGHSHLFNLAPWAQIAQGFLGSNLNYHKRDDNHIVLFFFSTFDLKREMEFSSSMHHAHSI